MFWSHQENRIEAPVESIGQYLKEELRLRLRVAADFATLGAYELLEADEGPVERAAPEAAAERVTLAAPPKRVLLFAKVAPVCPHSGPAEPACTKKRSATGPRSRRVRTLRQRGGSVLAPEQPCAYAGKPAPGA
jgi:hypothetical protein